MLSGNDALGRALAASRLRTCHGFVGVPLHRLVEGLGARRTQGVTYVPAQSDLFAAALALGGALLSGGGTGLFLRAGGMNFALEALATLGLMNELRSPSVIIAGFDPGPTIAATAQDDRATLAHVCHLAQLDPGSPGELYHMTRLAAQASRLSGMPIVVRVSGRVLDTSTDVSESPSDPLDPTGTPWPVTYARSAGPYVMSSATYRYHVDKRARRLQQLEALVAACSTQVGLEGDVGVVLAGHLGPRAQSKVAARKLPSLRLGAAWPLPRRLLESFLRERREVIVIEEGEHFLERELQGLVHSLGLSCRVRGVEGPRPMRLDDEHLDRVLRRLGESVADVRLEERPPAAWREAQDTLIALAPIDMEPWPFFLGRARKKLWGFGAEDPRAQLIGQIRALDRPSLIVADPSAAAMLGFRERLIDVKAGFGQAPSIAGALSSAEGVEERPGAPLAVALLGDLNVYQASLLGIIDNVAHRRDVLHVILVRELPAPAGGAPGTTIEGLLRGLDMPYLTARLGGPDVAGALAAMVGETGPRALVCLGAGREEAIGG